MVNGEPPQSYKIPFKACHNSTIDHNLVTISLSLEWPERSGDDPNLVIEVTNKQLSSSYLPQNHSSIPVNPVHYHHPHQETIGLTYQPQLQQPQYYHTLTHDPSSSTFTNHNTVTSGPTTLVYNPIQPQLQSSTAALDIQKIKADLLSPFPSVFPCQPTSNPPYLSSQHVMQTPSTNMNDPRLDLNMSTITPPSSIKSVSSMFIDSTMNCKSPTTKSTFRSVVCNCPHPTIFHMSSCPAFTRINQELSLNSSSSLSPETFYQTNVQRVLSTHQSSASSSITIPSMTDPMITATFVPVPNSNLMKSLDTSSSVTTIISQPTSFLNNTQLCSTIKTPSMDNNNIYQQPSVNVSQFIFNSQSNFPTNSSMSTMEQQIPPPITKPRPRKKPIKPKNQNTNNAPTKIEDNKPPPPKIVSSPIHTTQNPSQDNPQTTDKPTVDPIQRSSSPMHSNVRSPVSILLDPSTSQNLPSTNNKNNDNDNDNNEVIDQVLDDVVDGKVPIKNPSSSTKTTTQQAKPSLSSQIVWESSGPITRTRTFLSTSNQDSKPSSTTYDSNTPTLPRQNSVDITPQILQTDQSAQNSMNTSSSSASSSPTQKSSTKRTGPKSTKTSDSKRTNNSPSSQQNLIQTQISTNKQASWPDTPISSASSVGGNNGTVSNSNQYSINDPLSMTDIDNDTLLTHYSDLPNDSTNMLNLDEAEFEDIFSSKTDSLFASSTPPLLTMNNPGINSPSIDRSSNILSTSEMNSDIYAGYFPLRTPVAVWDENNHAPTSILTPPDQQNNHNQPPPPHSNINNKHIILQ